MKSIREQIQILISLQVVDRRIHAMRQEKEQIPRELDSQRTLLKEQARKVDEVRQRLEKLEQEQRAIEHEIQLEKEQIKRYEERVTQIKTNKEYQALLKEISVAKNMKEQSEDELLKSMMVLDETKREMTILETERKRLEQEFQGKEKELLAKLAEVERSIVGVVDERNRVAVDVDRTLLQRYDLILQKREGIAVARAADEMCLACNRNIPPQVYNELLKYESLLTCPGCQRILYYESLGDEAELEVVG